MLLNVPVGASQVGFAAGNPDSSEVMAMGKTEVVASSGAFSRFGELEVRSVTALRGVDNSLILSAAGGRGCRRFTSGSGSRAVAFHGGDDAPNQPSAQLLHKAGVAYTIYDMRKHNAFRGIKPAVLGILL